MKFFLLIILIANLLLSKTLEINILYLEQKIKQKSSLSNVIEEPTDSGLQGARLSIIDRNKGAKFLNQKYILQEEISNNEKSLILAFEKFVNEKNVFVILNVENSLFLKLINHPLSKNVLFVNSANKNSLFRKNICKKNVLHTIASNDMLSDALVQFLVKRNWKKWLTIKSKNDKDKEIELSFKKSAKKFGGEIVEEKIWEETSDIRRKAQSEMPSFTQSKDHDVVILFDYYGDFGEYVYFNTWRPRPIAGTQGLRAVTWHKVIEAWGAAQLQNRFEAYSNRWMNSKDYASYIAIKSISTAIFATKTISLKENIKYIYSDAFKLGSYKGRTLSFRKFNGQLRQPIALIHPRALVSTSPQLGFLHPLTDLDTLGISKYEMDCKY